MIELSDSANQKISVEEECSRTSRKLTPLQQRFVTEYLVDLNGTKAAVRAGYLTGDVGLTEAFSLIMPAIMGMTIRHGVG